MRNSLATLLRNNFFKNVITLSSGTFISQIIVLLASPLLARIYSIESFGHLAVYTSFTTFLAVLSTGRYELAIGLPPKEKDALRLIKLILYIGVSVSLFYLISIFLLREVLKFSDSAGFLKIKEVYIAPFYIFLIAVNSALNFWKNRKKRYKEITIANAIQVISTTIFSLSLGFFKIDNGMIWALIVGMLTGCTYYIYKEPYLLSQLVKITNIKKVKNDYISFPKFMTFSDLSLVASQQFIPILFSVLFSTTIVGFYSMANRVLRLPNVLITYSIGNVFRNDAIDELRLHGNCKDLYLSVLKKLFAISLPIYFIIFVGAPYIFVFIFGDEWKIAGHFAQIISVFLFFEFVAFPLNNVFSLRNHLKLLMILQSLNSVLGGILIYVGYKIYGDPIMSLWFYSLNSVFFSVVMIIFSYLISKKEGTIIEQVNSKL